MLPTKSITVIEKSINIDFSQQICLSIFIHFRYNQLILLLLIECYRLSRPGYYNFTIVEGGGERGGTTSVVSALIWTINANVF